MELEILEPVLTEILQELKAVREINHNLVESVGKLEQRTMVFDQKLEKVKLVVPPVDTHPINEIISENMALIASIVEAQPKNIIKRHQVLLFPENDTKEYYRFISGRIIPWIVGFFVVYFLFCLGRQAIDKSTVSKERRVTYEQYQNAWAHLDTIAGPALREKMDEAWRLASNPHSKESD